MRAITWVLAVAALATPAFAREPAARTLRVIGEAAAPIEGAPARFVIDAVITPGDAAFQGRLEGWFAALPPAGDSDEIEGDCVEARCALSADGENGKLAISADLAGPGAPGAGKLALTDDEDKTVETAVRFTPITGPVPGLGTLAAPGAIGASELTDLLMWAGYPTGFSNSDDEAVDWLQREALAEWQAGRQRPGGGLILVEDLALLRGEAVQAKRAADWRPLGGGGWTGGYPAAVLPKASGAAPEQRFASADGAAVLVVAIDPPLDGDAWDALVDQVTTDRDGVEGRSYTRVNDEMEISYEEKGRVHAAAYHRREGGLARLEFSFPAAQRETYERYVPILQRSLRAGKDLKR